MLYPVFMASFNPHWRPLSALILRNIHSFPNSRRGNRLWEVQWLTLYLKPAVMERQDLNSCVPALTSVLALFTSVLPTPSFGPLSCTNLSLLELPGCIALVLHEPIRFFSLRQHSVSVFLFIKREGRKSNLNPLLISVMVSFGRKSQIPVPQ